MRLQALLRMTLVGLMVIQALGLPIEKELLRVKRKGDTEEEEGNGGQRLHRREVAPVKESLEDDREIRRKRRFQSHEVVEKNDAEKYPNKMAARSSRSSREDNDITARGMERFLIRENKSKGIKQPAKRSTSGSGSGWESEINASGSGSGLWISDSAAKEIVSQKDQQKRSASSLENIVAALSTVSREHLPHGENEDSSSGSGLWENSGSNSDDDLPKFFSAAASNSHYMEVGRVGSGSGSGMDEANASKQTNLVSDLAEEVHQDRKAKHAEPAPEPEPTKQKRSSDNHIHKRDILHQFFEGPDVIYRSRREKIDTDLEEKLASYFRNLKGDQVASHEPDNPHEPPPIPAVTTSKRKSKVIKTARDVTSSQGNDDSEGLTGLSLVKRFYRDQNMEETGQIKKVYPDSVSILKDIASIPLQNEEKRSAIPAVQKNTAKKHPESNEIKRSNPFEPRVVHKKELPRAHVTIIEEPAVYSKTEEGMDSSEGGMNVEEDESEPAIEIHERDIREDGYVGCYADQSPNRDLPFPVSVRKLTPTTCRMACKDAGQAYAGLQYGYLCRCGNSYGKYTRLGEEQCSTACKGDKTQICGGFFRSSIYATEGVTEPTQGNFLHVESIRPLNTPIKSQAATPNYMPPVTPNYQPYLQPNPLPYSGPMVHFAPNVQAPAYFAPEEPKIIYHSETPLPVLPVRATVKARVVNVPRFPQLRYYPSVLGTMQPQRKSTIARPSTPKPPPQPQRTHVIRPNYLHKQRGVVSGLKPQVNIFGHLATNPGTQIFTGTVKLRQSWLDGLKKEESPEYKILSGNIEQAFKKMFKKEPKFISAKVHGFSQGILRNNPATIRKVVAAFSLTFQRGTSGIENKVIKDVKGTGKLFDMPAFKQSIQIQEYHKMPETAPSITKNQVESNKDAKKDVKRSNVHKRKKPYTLELFLMKDPTGKKTRKL